MTNCNSNSLIQVHCRDGFLSYNYLVGNKDNIDKTKLSDCIIRARKVLNAAAIMFWNSEEKTQDTVVDTNRNFLTIEVLSHLMICNFMGSC